MWESHNWSRGDRILIGAFLLLPLSFGALVALVTFLELVGSPWTAGATVMPLVGYLLPFALAMVGLLLVPVVLNDRRLSRGARAWWLIGFLFAGFVVVPLFWYFQVWKAPYGRDPARRAPQEDGSVTDLEPLSRGPERSSERP
jgi:hypothetical protein